MVHVSPQPPSGYISPNLQCSPTQSPIPVTVVAVDAVIVVVGVVCRPVCRNICIILIVQFFIYSFTYLYNMFVHLSNDGVELVRGVVTKTWLHPPRCALGFGRRQISICNARPCTYVISRRVYWTSDRHFLGPISRSHIFRIRDSHPHVCDRLYSQICTRGNSRRSCATFYRAGFAGRWWLP